MHVSISAHSCSYSGDAVRESQSKVKDGGDIMGMACGHSL